MNQLSFTPESNYYMLINDDNNKSEQKFIGEELSNLFNRKIINNFFKEGAVKIKPDGGFSIPLNKPIEIVAGNLSPMELFRHIDRNKRIPKEFKKGTLESLKKIIYGFFCQNQNNELSEEKLKALLIKNGFERYIIPSDFKYFSKDNHNNYREVWRPAIIPDLVGDIAQDLKKLDNYQIARVYDCPNDSDEIFYYTITLAREAVLHKLKITYCLHCGKLFFTDTFKKKYCHRNSPIKNYTHLNCEQASKNIKQQLRRQKKNIYNHLYNYNPDYVDEFLVSSDKYYDNLKLCPSKENISACQKFCDKWKTRFKSK